MNRALANTQSRPSGVHASSEGQTKLALVAKVTLISLVVPALLSVGGLSLTPSRIVFLIITIPLIVNLFAGKYGKLVITDFLVIFFTYWMLQSIFINNNSVAFVFGGMQALTLLGGYMAGRAAVRSVQDFQALARFMAYLVLFLLPLALFEAFTSVPLPFQILNALPVVQGLPFVPSTPRLGIDRAQVVFTHPIHFGLFCSLPISLYFVGLTNKEGPIKRWRISGLVLFTCFLSVSSGPLLAGAFQLMLVGYLLTTRNFGRVQWPMLLGSLVVVYSILEVLSSRSALYAIAERLAFNPATANIRRALWEVGSEQVAKAPWIGVGFNKWDHPPWMTGSVDNYWLAMAILYGLPASLAMAATFLALMFGMGRGKLKAGSDLYYARVAATFVLVSLSLSIATVAIWGELLSAVYFLLGAFAFLLQKDIVMADQAVPKTGQIAQPVQVENRRGGGNLPGRARPATSRGAGGDPVTPRYTRFAPKSAPLKE